MSISKKDEAQLLKVMTQAAELLETYTLDEVGEALRKEWESREEKVTLEEEGHNCSL